MKQLSGIEFKFLSRSYALFAFKRSSGLRVDGVPASMFIYNDCYLNLAFYE